MDRLEFCKLITAAKQESKTSTMDIVRETGIYPIDVRYLERGTRNSKMSTYMKYIAVVKHKMVISMGKEVTEISSYSDLLQWMLQAMGGGSGYSMAQKFKDIGFYETYISFMKTPNRSVTVDKFLALVNKLECKIKLVNNEL